MAKAARPLYFWSDAMVTFDVIFEVIRILAVMMCVGGIIYLI